MATQSARRARVPPQISIPDNQPPLYPSSSSKKDAKTLKIVSIILICLLMCVGIFFIVAAVTKTWPFHFKSTQSKSANKKMTIHQQALAAQGPGCVFSWKNESPDEPKHSGSIVEINTGPKDGPKKKIQACVSEQENEAIFRLFKEIAKKKEDGKDTSALEKELQGIYQPILQRNGIDISSGSQKSGGSPIPSQQTPPKQTGSTSPPPETSVPSESSPLDKSISSDSSDSLVDQIMAEEIARQKAIVDRQEAFKSDDVSAQEKALKDFEKSDMQLQKLFKQSEDQLQRSFDASMQKKISEMKKKHEDEVQRERHATRTYRKWKEAQDKGRDEQAKKLKEELALIRKQQGDALKQMEEDFDRKLAEQKADLQGKIDEIKTKLESHLEDHQSFSESVKNLLSQHTRDIENMSVEQRRNREGLQENLRRLQESQQRAIDLQMRVNVATFHDFEQLKIQMDQQENEFMRLRRDVENRFLIESAYLEQILNQMWMKFNQKINLKNDALRHEMDEKLTEQDAQIDEMQTSLQAKGLVVNLLHSQLERRRDEITAIRAQMGVQTERIDEIKRLQEALTAKQDLDVNERERIERELNEKQAGLERIQKTDREKAERRLTEVQRDLEKYQREVQGQVEKLQSQIDSLKMRVTRVEKKQNGLSRFVNMELKRQRQSMSEKSTQDREVIQGQIGQLERYLGELKSAQTDLQTIQGSMIAVSNTNVIAVQSQLNAHALRVDQIQSQIQDTVFRSLQDNETRLKQEIADLKVTEQWNRADLKQKVEGDLASQKKELKELKGQVEEMDIPGLKERLAEREAEVERLQQGLDEIEVVAMDRDSSDESTLNFGPPSPGTDKVGMAEISSPSIDSIDSSQTHVSRDDSEDESGVNVQERQREANFNLLREFLKQSLQKSRDMTHHEEIPHRGGSPGIIGREGDDESGLHTNIRAEDEPVFKTCLEQLDQHQAKFDELSERYSQMSALQGNEFIDNVIGTFEGYMNVLRSDDQDDVVDRDATCQSVVTELSKFERILNDPSIAQHSAHEPESVQIDFQTVIGQLKLNLNQLNVRYDTIKGNFEPDELNQDIVGYLDSEFPELQNKLRSPYVQSNEIQLIRHELGKIEWALNVLELPIQFQHLQDQLTRIQRETPGFEIDPRIIDNGRQIVQDLRQLIESDQSGLLPHLRDNLSLFANQVADEEERANVMNFERKKEQEPAQTQATESHNLDRPLIPRPSTEGGRIGTGDVRGEDTSVVNELQVRLNGLNQKFDQIRFKYPQFETDSVESTQLAEKINSLTIKDTLNSEEIDQVESELNGLERKWKDELAKLVHTYLPWLNDNLFETLSPEQFNDVRDRVFPLPATVEQSPSIAFDEEFTIFSHIFQDTQKSLVDRIGGVFDRLRESLYVIKDPSSDPIGKSIRQLYQSIAKNPADEHIENIFRQIGKQFKKLKVTHNSDTQENRFRQLIFRSLEKNYEGRDLNSQFEKARKILNQMKNPITLTNFNHLNDQFDAIIEQIEGAMEKKERQIEQKVQKQGPKKSAKSPRPRHASSQVRASAERTEAWDQTKNWIPSKIDRRDIHELIKNNPGKSTEELVAISKKQKEKQRPGGKGKRGKKQGKKTR